MQSNSKKKSSTDERSQDLRAEADAKVMAWRDTTQAATVARERFNAARTLAERNGTARSGNARLALIELEVQTLEAEDVATRALADATRACDAADVADGDALALRCDPTSVHTEFSRRLAEVERLRVEHAAAVALAWRCLEDATPAAEALDARRRAASLPPPATPPRAPSVLFARPPEMLKESLAELRRRISDGPTPGKSNAVRIQKLDRERIEIASALEQERLDREERLAEAASARDADRRMDQGRERERQKTQAATLAERQAEIRKREALAGAYLSRPLTDPSRALSDSGPGGRTFERIVDGESGALLED